jgi:NDP-hexose-3-ketoreductase
MQKIRLGVLGCAAIATRSVIPAVKSIDSFELVAVASRTKAKAEQVATRFNTEAIEGYQTLLERDDINAVYVPLPTGLHDEWLHKALDAGKHVLAEKSLAESYSSCQQLVEKAAQKGLLLMEDFMFRYHAQHVFVRDLISRGEIGEVRLFRSSFGFPPFPSGNFRYDKSLGGGALLDAAAYTIKATQLFLGFDVEVKAATLHYDKALGVDLYGGAFLVNNQGIASEVAWGFDNFYQCNYEIWGSKGKIVAERAFTPPPDMKPKIVLEQAEKRVEFLAPNDNHFVNILKEFHRAIVERDIKAHLEETLNQSRLLEDVRQKNASLQEST